jgi:hypothetical protein
MTPNRLALWLLTLTIPQDFPIYNKNMFGVINENTNENNKKNIKSPLHKKEAIVIM